MRIAVINPNTSEPVTGDILAAAWAVAGRPTGLVAFTAARCAGMSGLRDAVSRGTGVPVVDGVRAAVVLAEGLVRCRLATSKAGTFSYPEPLPYAGMTAPSQVVGQRSVAGTP
jgi:Asp/Glu/hydantoin racemase